MYHTQDMAFRSLQHRRSENQDRCFSMSCDGMPDLREKMSILAVLDGVSSSNGGRAAHMASQAMRPVLAELLGKSGELLTLDDESRRSEIHQYLCTAVREADRCLRREQTGELECGTTVTLAVLFGEAVYAANVGDSPAYLLRISMNGTVGQLQPLFECHNMAGEAVRRGLMTKEEALTHQSRNALMRMVGGSGIVRNDIHTTFTWLSQSDVLLLGSDGALSVVTEEKLVQLVNENLCSGLTDFIDELYETVRESDSRDNFTVLAQWVKSD